MPRIEANVPTAAGTANNPSYNDFEPFSNWSFEEGRNTLVLNLPGFKKEQLKVLFCNPGVLKISGERPLNRTVSSRFYKEVKVPKKCKPEDIRAKFVDGLLYVVLPTTKIPSSNKNASLAKLERVEPDDRQNDPNERLTSPDQDGIPSSYNKEMALPSPQQSYVPSSRNCAKIALQVAVPMAFVLAIGAYILYRYNPINFTDVDASDV